MRKVLCLMMVCLLCLAPLGLAEDMVAATDALFTAIEEKVPGSEMPRSVFYQQGQWMSAVAEYQSGNFTQWAGIVYDMEAGEFVDWDDMFTDGNAAAARIEAVIAESVYDNAYSEHNDVSPVPRDNFAVEENTLVIYYPAEQLSHFSGRAGVFSFYPYELDGLLAEGVPLAMGDLVQAKDRLAEALETGILAGCALGGAMQQADTDYVLVDVPDFKDQYAVWHFEAPTMRGVSLLSDENDSRVATATITGIFAERMDFSGLCTGIATREQCVQSLGEPNGTVSFEASDAYNLLPAGETLYYEGSGNVLELHFVEDVLHSVLLRTL